VCGKQTLIYSRIVGYYRPTRDWNRGKQLEFTTRKYYKLLGGQDLSELDSALDGFKMGLLKSTTIDYPGRLASMVFTVGCNFRCPWCHNKDIAFPELIEQSKEENEKYFTTAREVIQYLKASPHKAVVVSGGEPTIQKALIPFLRAVKAIDVDVKLDTNGSRPDVLKQIIDEKLVDLIAMDVKGPLTAEYTNFIGQAPVDIEDIEKSVEMIKLTPHIFRTTIIPDLHTDKVMDQIRTDISKRGAGIITQPFKDYTPYDK
jgi:anaerobic ribonucleoside-triphosphate reductase activating protein